jgi:hypothetical protein
MLLHSTVDYKLLSSIKRQNRKMRITEGNSGMIWHSRGMDKDWPLCHSRSEARPRYARGKLLLGESRYFSLLLTSAKKELKQV